MTNSIPNTADDNMLEEYNFSKGIRGKYVDRFKEGSKIVILSPDADEVLKDSGRPPRPAPTPTRFSKNRLAPRRRK